MTHLRLVLLATTALTALQFAAASSYAQTAPMVVAQAKDLGPAHDDVVVEKRQSDKQTENQ